METIDLTANSQQSERATPCDVIPNTEPVGAISVNLPSRREKNAFGKKKKNSTVCRVAPEASSSCVDRRIGVEGPSGITSQSKKRGLKENATGIEKKKKKRESPKKRATVSPSQTKKIWIMKTFSPRSSTMITN